MAFQMESLNWTRVLISESDRKWMESAQDAAKDTKESTDPIEGNDYIKVKSSHVYNPS